MIWQTKSTSSADTERLGELLGSLLKGGEVIELRSDLGGGKTTFVKGLVRGAGSKDRAASPTFTLSRVYRTGKMSIFHYDFYRLSDPGILADQLAESLSDDKAVVVVEWADIVKEVLPREHISINLESLAAEPDERAITFTYPEDLQTLIANIETLWQESKP